MPKQYLVYCEVCGYRKVVADTPKGIEGLVPFKTANVPAGIPKLDPKTNKVVFKPSIETMPKYKCPQCGRVVTTKRLPKPLMPPPPEPKKQSDPFQGSDGDANIIKEDLRRMREELDG